MPLKVVLWIRIHHNLYGSRSGSFIIKQNRKKNLDFYCFVTSLWLFIFEDGWKCKLPKVISKKTWRSLTKRACRIRIRKSVVWIRGPDPYQNVKNPHHWPKIIQMVRNAMALFPNQSRGRGTSFTVVLQSRYYLPPPCLLVPRRGNLRGKHWLYRTLCVKGLCLGLVGVGWERLKAVSG